MKIIKGIKIGGLQQKIFNLMLFFLIALIGAFIAISVYQQKNLTATVQEANDRQQKSIETVSEDTMRAVLNTTMTQTTALQAYIADDLFTQVRADVLTLQAFASELLAHKDGISAHSVEPPSKRNDGTPTAQLIHEQGVDPSNSQTLGVVANMSEIMLAMYGSTNTISSVYVATADGNMVLVNDRSSTFVGDDGSVLPLDIRHRPWFVQAAEAGTLIFTGVEMDAYTNSPMLVCAAPVYDGGELAAVVAADIYLSSINDYVASKASAGSFVCVINGSGQMLFSPQEEGVFRVELAADAPDLRENENRQLADFIASAMEESTGLCLVEVDGKAYYMCGTPMKTVGWTAVSVVERELTRQPTVALLDNYDRINREALSTFENGTKNSARTLVVLLSVICLLAIFAALAVASKVVKPLEHMTKRINALSGSDAVFEMEPIYRTKDEIEVLAESFATLSKRTREYITQITQITAEKERIGAELSLATRIQSSMLPTIFPPYPDRSEFDIYASMDPAKEVGGDFYDFFLVDEDHLCVVMADVSGKGVPAALFMMASKIILQSCAMLGQSPAEILTKTNEAICSNNPESMFVTVWVGILEISTGKLTAANAGHEFPILKTPRGCFEVFKDRHGLVIGGMAGLKYRQYELMLEPGSKLFLYTDGVPEATDAENQLFGLERTVAALNQARDETPEQILKAVRRSVDDFVKEAEQFDDLTMLCLEYKGRE